MGRFFRLWLMGALFVTGVFGVSAGALAYTSPGKPEGYVNDFANVLTTAQQSELERSIEAYEQKTKNELAVVTVPSTGRDSIESYANALFQEWGIGKKDKDNGVLLLLAIQDRKLRIEVGYGLEGVLTDAASADIIQNAKSTLRIGDYHGAIFQMVDAIESTLTPSAAVPGGLSKSRSIPSAESWVVWIIGGLFLAVFILFNVGIALYVGGSIALVALVLSVERSRGAQWVVMREWLKTSRLFNPVYKGLTSKPGEFKISSRNSRSGSGSHSHSSSHHSSFGGGRSGGGGSSGSW